MKIILIIFLCSLFVQNTKAADVINLLNLCQEQAVERDGGEVNPNDVYMVWGFAVSSQPQLIKIVNGKISDENGNFTLTSKEIRDGDRCVYVKWDNSPEYETEGKISYGRISRTFVIGQENYRTFGGSFNPSVWGRIDFWDLEVAGVKIENGQSYIIHGTNSVILKNGFHAKAGSYLRVYNAANEMFKDYDIDPTRPMTEIYNAKSIPLGENQMSITEVSLYQNMPNPFHAETCIRFRLPEGCDNAYIQIVSVSGEVVKKIPVELGTDEVILHDLDLPSGMYLYSLYADGKLIGTNKMVKN